MFWLMAKYHYQLWPGLCSVFNLQILGQIISAKNSTLLTNFMITFQKILWKLSYKAVPSKYFHQIIPVYSPYPKNMSYWEQPRLRCELMIRPFHTVIRRAQIHPHKTQRCLEFSSFLPRLCCCQNLTHQAKNFVMIRFLLVLMPCRSYLVQVMKSYPHTEQFRDPDFSLSAVKINENLPSLRSYKYLLLLSFLIEFFEILLGLNFFFHFKHIAGKNNFWSGFART